MAELWRSPPQAIWIQSPNNPTLSQANPDVASRRRLDNAWTLGTHILDRPIKADVRMVAGVAAEEILTVAQDSAEEGTTAAQEAGEEGFITAAQEAHKNESITAAHEAAKEGPIKAQEGKDDGIFTLGRGDCTAVENPIGGISCLSHNAKRQRSLQKLDAEPLGAVVKAKGHGLRRLPLTWWEREGRAKGVQWSEKSNSHGIAMGID